MIRRLGAVISRDDIPAAEARLRDVSSVFNPGAARFQGEEILVLRVQTRGRETVLLLAYPENGGFRIRPEPVAIGGLDTAAEGIHHVYDPRLTVLEDMLYMVFAADVDDGCRLGLARKVKGDDFELISLDREGDRRNGVLFPELIGGRYARLERPNRPRDGASVSSGDRVEIAYSDDLVDWKDRQTVFEGRPRRWDELVGPGPPPLRAEAGWLLLYHGVATHHGAGNLYQMGAILLDAGDPARVLARTRENLLEPRELYELTGQVPGVVFPSGCLPGREVGELAATDTLTVYYGAADTCVAAAEVSVGYIIDACLPVAP